MDDVGEAGNRALRPTDGAVRAALAASQGDFLRFLARRLGTREDAEDALQEVWLKVVAGKAALGKGANVEAWLRRVLRNVAVDQHRRRAARRRAEEALRREPGPAAAGEPAAALDAVACACLHRLLPTLKPEYAELLWRVDLAGQPRGEVARQLDLTPNNLAVRLHRARQALRKRLEQTCATCPTHGFLSCACPRRPPRPDAAGRTVRPARPARLRTERRAGAAPGTGTGTVSGETA